MVKKHEGCVATAAGPIVAADAAAQTPGEKPDGRDKMRAQVGKPAPDFEATAFVDKGFQNIKLSDYKGKWVALCFYPGDFTFV